MCTNYDRSLPNPISHSANQKRPSGPLSCATIDICYVESAGMSSKSEEDNATLNIETYNSKFFE